MFRYMPINRIAFWLTSVHFGMFVLQTIILVVLGVYARVLDWTMVISAFTLFVALVSYVRSARYLAFRRADMTAAQQIQVFALSPLVSVLYTFVLVPVRYYALIRLRSQEWGTRSQAEIIQLEYVS